MQENFERNFDPDTHKFLALEKLCPTRWTVHASYFQKIIDTYCLLLKLWDEYLKESLDTETRSRIIGCKAHMKTFKFFLSLPTHNLSKTLKKEKISAVSRQRLASLTAKTIQSMRNDADFHLFYQTVCKKAERIDDFK